MSSKHLSPYAATGQDVHPSRPAAGRLGFLCSPRGYCVDSTTQKPAFRENRNKSRILTTTGPRTWDRRYASNIASSDLVTLALRKLSLKKVAMLVFEMLFIASSPINSSKERLSLIWSSRTSSLILK